MPSRFAITVCASLLMAGSLVMELGVALPAWAARAREDSAALDAVRRSPNQVLVIDSEIDLQLVGPDYFDRRIFYVAWPALWAEFASDLRAGGEREFLLVSRERSAPRRVGDFRFDTEEVVWRYHLQHYVR